MPEAIIVPNPPDAPPEEPTEVQLEQQSATKHPDWYFDSTHFFFKILRFLNLLEPDRTVISMTKIMLWGATIQSMLVISTSSDWLTVAGALGLNVATMVKHERRRGAGHGHGDGDGDGE